MDQLFGKERTSDCLVKLKLVNCVILVRCNGHFGYCGNVDRFLRVSVKQVQQGARLSSKNTTYSNESCDHPMGGELAEGGNQLMQKVYYYTCPTKKYYILQFFN